MRNHVYKIILLLFVILISNIISAQSIVPVETLEQRLKAHGAQDTFRVNILNQLAWHSDIRVSMRDSLVNQSLQLSNRLHYLKGKAVALIVQSQYAQMNEAVPMAQEALAIAKQSGDSGTQFWAYRLLGEALLNTTEGAKALQPFQQALQVAEALHNTRLITYAATALTDYYKQFQLNYPLALQWSLKALQTAEQSGSQEELGQAYRNIGAVYQLIGDRQKAIDNLQKALAASRQAGDWQTVQFVLNDMGEQYRITGKYKEALQAYSEAAKLIKDTFNTELNNSNIASVYQRMGNDSLCFIYAFASLHGARAIKDTIGISWIDYILSSAHLHRHHPDSALLYALQGYQYSLQTQMIEYQRDNSEALANAYAMKKEYAKAFSFYKIFISARDSLINTEVTNKSNLQQYNYDLSKKQSQIAVLNKDKQLQQAQVQRQQYFLISLVTGLILVITTLILLYRNSRQRKKDYALLQQEKLHVQLQRDQTNHALTELKSTQAQLIQAEKMASLGELTAGIAHEIQNPLNFVNNFSELNKELLEELKDELTKGNADEAKQIAEDVIENETKINHHGKRADAIVKGMLQHSRQTKGIKEPTDLNALCDEYLRLSFHGLRAKDKNFNADFVTDFDENMGKIKIVPQDMGRVLLNLFNNAFYAVNERQKKEGEVFKPLVSVQTKRQSPPSGVGDIEIVVKDNGNGIPQHIIDKIFQPFFTTKPTGQGTGLGLSLSYDIITKEHNGAIKVESKEGEGTMFTITLPMLQ